MTSVSTWNSARAAGWLLVAACGHDVAVGALLWRGRREGAWLAVASTPLSLALAIGFALPLLRIGLPLAALLLLLGRSKGNVILAEMKGDSLHSLLDTLDDFLACAGVADKIVLKKD